MKRILLIFLLLAILGIGAFAYCSYLIQQASKGRIYDRAESVPPRDWGIVPGTSAHLGNGDTNPYFRYRIAAAAKLYRLGKIKHILVSGDNRTANYNEPEDMRRALIEQQVPAAAIRLDYAGLRTLDTVVRAEKIFGLHRFTIISQREHDARALLITQYYKIDAIAFAADDVEFQYSRMSHVHEWLADIKAPLDLYVLHTAPKHLGAREAVN
jgi:SanA protein